MLTIIPFKKIIWGYLTHSPKHRDTMANTAQAKKRAKQAEKSRIRNAGQRSNLRTFVKKVIAAVNAGDKEKAQAAYQIVVPIIDSAVTKGIIHKNKAARGKSRLNSKVKAIV
jgi:small subunit ribosomal protein S20